MARARWLSLPTRVSRWILPRTSKLQTYISSLTGKYLSSLIVSDLLPVFRQNPKPQWDKLKEDHPFGFDVVVEATGVESVVQDSINYVRRGGTLLVYGVYEDKARVSWPPSKIFSDEIRVCHRGSCSISVANS